MANYDTSSINRTDPATESILHVYNSEFIAIEPRNSSEITHNYLDSIKETPEISPIIKKRYSEHFQDIPSLPISETSTNTITPIFLRKASSMKSISSHGTESNTSLISTKLPPLDGLPPLHPIQIKILREVKRNLEISREKVIKLETENKQIPVLKKRLDQLETELRLQSIISPEESALSFSNLLSSSVPVSQLSSSQLPEMELSPAMILVEVHRTLNCDGADLANILDDKPANKDFLTPLRKVLLKRISELKKTELQGASAHQKMLDTLSRQVVCINARSEEVNRKLADFKASIKMVSTAREEISKKGRDYFQEQWDSVVRDKTPVDERVVKLQLQCTQLQQKVDHYKNSIMFYKTENDTLITQLQPFKTASKATTSILEEVKSLRSLVVNTQKENSARTAENASLSEELESLKKQTESQEGDNGLDKFRKLEEERDSANRLAQDCQQKASTLSASLHQVSSLMMEEKNRGEALSKQNKELEKEIQSLRCELGEFKPQLESQLSGLKSDLRMKEREVAQLLESLQRHEMTKDDLRRAEKELKQFRTKSQFFETRNRELTGQLTLLVEKESTEGDRMRLEKQEELIHSIQALFSPPEPAMTLLDQVQGLHSDLRDSQELVEFLQQEKKVEAESLATHSTQSEPSDVKLLSETITQLQSEKSLLSVSQSHLKSEIAEMKLTREAFISRMETLETQLEDSNATHSTTDAELIDKLQKQSEVDKAHHEMRIQDLTDQIAEQDSVMQANDIQSAKERDLLQTRLESLTLDLAQAKDKLAKQTAELEDRTDQIDHLKRELEVKRAKAKEMMEKFFPGGAPTAQLVNEANQKLQESLSCEKDQILSQQEDHQKLEQQVTLLDTWVQQYKAKIDSLEEECEKLKEANQANKEVNQANLKKIMKLEAAEIHCTLLKKELKEVEREVSALRIQRETDEQKIQDLSQYK